MQGSGESITEHVFKNKLTRASGQRMEKLTAGLTDATAGDRPAVKYSLRGSYIGRYQHERGGLVFLVTRFSGT
ncbi:hypothetical protein GCM10009414_05670 [Tatumella terrea]